MEFRAVLLGILLVSSIAGALAGDPSPVQDFCVADVNSTRIL